MGSKGSAALNAYLEAPPQVREAFDRFQSAAIERTLIADRDVERWAEVELADDPIAVAVRKRRHKAHLVMRVMVEAINWTASWERRAHADPGAAVMPYSRDADPLLALDLREVWPELTGADIRGTISTCPSPDHEDRVGSCGVKPRFFNCFVCEAGGTIIDLGALLYEIEPRGAGFFQIRERLLADLGVDG